MDSHLPKHPSAEMVEPLSRYVGRLLPALRYRYAMPQETLMDAGWIFSGTSGETLSYPFSGRVRYDVRTYPVYPLPGPVI